MKLLRTLRLMAIVFCTGFVLAWAPGLPALAPPPPLAKITLVGGKIEIDKNELDASRRQAIVWWIENHYDDEKAVELTNFQIGTRSGDECTDLKRMNQPPLRGRLEDRKVEGAEQGEPGTGIIAVVVKKNADETCYKYDITATGLPDLDPRLSVGRH
jgi:hypothetical protein